MQQVALAKRVLPFETILSIASKRKEARLRKAAKVAVVDPISVVGKKFIHPV
jgi:hypothetical protein